jgi:hypothetical protein
VPPLDETVSYYPPPSRFSRLLGLGAVVGAVLWPLALIVLASAANECGDQTECLLDRSTLLFIAIAPLGLAIGLIGLERRAPRLLGMLDFVGDLSIGTAACLFVVAFVAGSIGLVGPGLLLLLIGSVIFGIVGYWRGVRPRMASALVAIGAGGTILFLGLGAASAGGSGSGTGLEGASILGLALFTLGWAWLGIDLLLGRPLPILEPRR